MYSGFERWPFVGADSKAGEMPNMVGDFITLSFVHVHSIINVSLCFTQVTSNPQAKLETIVTNLILSQNYLKIA